MTMWGIAFSMQPREWRLGACDAVEDDGRIVGRWYCFGPVALTYDFD